LQITREPLPLPTLKLNPSITDIDGFTYEDIEVIGYEHQIMSYLQRSYCLRCNAEDRT
ncbi:MAG: thymidylate synthase, partial [Candidatus Poseidoniaceae archaeon]